MEYIIDVRNIYKTFLGKKVVNNLSLQMEKGRIYGFLGPNGSGKTTTIRMICGLLTPDSGSGTCLGYDITKDAEKIKPKIGYMTQKFSYWEDLTIAENLEFVANIYDLQNHKEKIQTVIDKLGLQDRKNQLAGNLSGGWKQLLALAACTLHKPEILLLDEPTAGVDPKARRAFWDEIHKLADDGITVLVSTHYMDEAERCHKIYYISSGDLIVSGSVESVIAQSGLKTLIATGKKLDLLSAELQKNLDVSAVLFGTKLHVSSTKPETLSKVTSNYSSYDWQVSEPSLEDAFIHYMNLSKRGP